MKSRTGIKAGLEYLAIRAAAFVLEMFPIEWNLRTARLFGRLWWRIDARHRRLAHEQLRQSYDGQLTEAQLQEIGRKCFEHWAMYLVEFLTAFRLLNEWSWPRYIMPGDLREALARLMSKNGAILLTGHYGNFELTAYMLAAVGFDMVAVMRPLDNKYFNDYVVRTRTRQGLKLLDKFGATTEAEDVLRRGGALGFVADQDAGRKGLFVDFFGRPASTYKSIGLLAMACEVPIIVGYARRVGDGFRYETGVQRIIDPVEWADRDDPLRWITQEYTKAIEDSVRDAPEQYLWIHRRWKSQPKPRRHRAERPSGGGTTGERPVDVAGGRS